MGDYASRHAGARTIEGNTMQIANRRAKKDVLNEEKRFVTLAGGAGFVQEGTLFDVDKAPAAGLITCVRHPNGVVYIIGEKGFDAGGRVVGAVDAANGYALTALKEKKAPVKKAPVKKAAKEAPDTTEAKPLAFGAANPATDDTAGDSLLD
jgi:hypothetical protein